MLPKQTAIRTHDQMHKDLEMSSGSSTSCKKHLPLTHDRFLHGSEIPCPLPGVYSGADNDVWLDSMPVDVRYIAIVRPKDMLDRCSPASAFE